MITHAPAAAELLATGLRHDRAGSIAAAIDAYAAAIEAADGAEPAAASDALRRLARLHHLRAEGDAARALAGRAAAVAAGAGLPVLAAAALNALGEFALAAGDLAEARERFESALELGGADPAVAGRVDRNIGLLHHVRGEWPEAAAQYRRAAALASRHGDASAQARAGHRLATLAAEQGQWEEAHRELRRAIGIALREGDAHLEARCLLDQARLHVALERWTEARDGAERALRTFDRLEARRDQSAAHRVLGVIFRETRRPALAESRLRSAVEIAVSARCPLNEAEARRELAELCWRQGRPTDALVELDTACRLFGRVGARADVAEVERRIDRARGALRGA